MEKPGELQSLGLQRVEHNRVTSLSFSPTPVFLGFPCGSAGKEAACNAGDLGLIPGLGRFSGEGKSYPFQYSGLENFMNYIDCVVSKNGTRLSDFHFHLNI